MIDVPAPMVCLPASTMGRSPYADRVDNFSNPTRFHFQMQPNQALRIYIDMDDVLCNYSAAISESRTRFPETEFPQSVAGFFENLKPIDGAIESVNQLRDSFDVYILSAPSTRNPLSYTEKRLWIEQHFDYEFTHRLILCSNKGLLKGDVLIDDHVVGRGQEEFEGELIHFGTPQFPRWEAVMDRLASKGTEAG